MMCVSVRSGVGIRDFWRLGELSLEGVSGTHGPYSLSMWVWVVGEVELDGVRVPSGVSQCQYAKKTSIWVPSPTAS